MVKGILGKRAEYEQAKLDHERLNSLVNSMADGVLAVDKTMHIVMSNGAALNILDINNSLRGKRLKDVMTLMDNNKQPVAIEALVHKTSTPTSTRDILLKYEDGSAMNLYLSIAPVHLSYGKRGQQGYVLLMRDITHEKSLEEERDEFISVASHELRTPIAIAEGNISNAQFMIDKTSDIHMVKVALKQAHDQVLFLADLINDLATLSRAQRGELDLEIAKIDVPQLIADLSASYTPEATAKGLGLKIQVAPNAKILQSSQLYVREILQNFITNALKYTEKGTITISAEVVGLGIRFTVADTGIGISKLDQRKLFDKFFRSEDYRTRKTNGTGLGLYVTLKLARLVHADIDVQSTLNKGSKFSIFVPHLGE